MFDYRWYILIETVLFFIAVSVSSLLSTTHEMLVTGKFEAISSLTISFNKYKVIAIHYRASIALFNYPSAEAVRNI